MITCIWNIYYFDQQYEDPFKIAGAQGHKQVPFAAAYL